MIEGRGREHQARIDGANPGKREEGIFFDVGIAQGLAGRVVRVLGIEGNLIEIAAGLRNQAKLVLRIRVVNQRSESAEAVGSVVENGRCWRVQAQVRAIAAEAGVVGEAAGVAAEIELIVGLKKIAGGKNQLGLVVALEAGARRDVEDSVGAIAIVGGVTAPLDFEDVDIFRVDLRPEIAGDVGVGDGHAVNEPTDLVPATNVKLVVREVGAGDEVSDHGETVGTRSPGRFLDLQAIHEAGGRDGFSLRCVSRNRDRLAL